MATVVPEVTTGTTITFSSSFFGAAKNQVTNISLSDMTRPSIKVSHFLTTGADEFIGGDLYDPGSLTFEFLFAAATAVPIGNAIEAVAVVFPGGSTWTWALSGNKGGFMTDFSFDGPLEDVMTGSATLKLSGAEVLS